MSSALPPTTISVNALTAPLVHSLVEQAERLRLAVHIDPSGVRLIDAGLAVTGSLEAGLAIGEVCLGGLGTVALRHRPSMAWPTWLEVRSSQPVLACLGSQYAGWSLAASKEEAGGKKFFSLGSGPARALAGKETLFAELGYRDQAASGCLVLEVDRMPPPVVIQKVLRDTGLSPEALTLIVTPTTSLAGSSQVVSRVLEVALHKAHTLGFDLAHIVDGTATAPLPATHPDSLVAMGRTNDAILYGGQVQLTVRGSTAEAQRLARELPSTNSRDHGRSFADIFTQYEYDFYKIDPALFAPAEVWVSHQESGQTWHAGRLALDLLHGLWLQEA